MIAPVLYVEDEENDVILMRRAFKSAGLDIPLMVVEDGRKAVEYLAGDGDYAHRDEFPIPRVVFLDLNLPHLPGLEVLKWIRAEPGWADLPVVILASSSEDAQIEEGRRLGATTHLVKPPSAAKLLDLRARFFPIRKQFS